MKSQIKFNATHTPRPVVFIHGFVDGRTHASGINGQSGHLDGAYISGKSFLFDEFVKKHISQLNQDLTSIRTEAEVLMLEYTSLPNPENGAPPSAAPTIPTASASKSTEDSRQKRSAAKKAAKAQQDAAAARQKHQQECDRRLEMLCRLVEIDHRIRSRELEYITHLKATSDALKERFMVYGHAVLLRAFSTESIPELDFTEQLGDYYATHADFSKRLRTIIDKNTIEQEG